MFSPFIYLTYPIPKVVLVPVVLLFLGIGDLAKIVIIFLILFFQILVLVRDQAAALRPELIQSVRSLGAGRRALFRFVYLPASLPAILTGVRQSIGTAVAVLYVAELFATQRGLGYYIYYGRQHPVRLPGHVRRHRGDEPAWGIYCISRPTGWRAGLCPWMEKHEINPRFFDLIKFEHTIFALPFAYLGMLLAASGLPTFRTVLLDHRGDGGRAHPGDGI